MRIIVNDDDFEDWIKLLCDLNKNINDTTLNYIIEQMQAELKFNKDVLYKNSITHNICERCKIESVDKCSIFYRNPLDPATSGVKK